MSLLKKRLLNEEDLYPYCLAFVKGKGNYCLQVEDPETLIREVESKKRAEQAKRDEKAAKKKEKEVRCL